MALLQAIILFLAIITSYIIVSSDIEMAVHPERFTKRQRAFNFNMIFPAAVLWTIFYLIQLV